MLAMALPAIASDTPRLSKAEVIRLADREAVRKGFDLRRFKRAQPRFNFAVRDNTWYVSYDPKGKEVEVGGDFSVHIDDRTKEVWLIPGR